MPYEVDKEKDKKIKTNQVSQQLPIMTAERLQSPDNRIIINQQMQPTQSEIRRGNTEPIVTDITITEATQRLNKYRSAKSSLEKRMIRNEQLYKLKQWDYIDDKIKKNRIKVNTAWLWNCISSKHADLMDCLPESNIKAKRRDDVAEANRLSSIIPVIFEENNYTDTYSNICDDFLKQGTVCVGVFWDGTKHDGLGDITIKVVDLLELFWESGVGDIQDSCEVFQTKYESKSKIEKEYSEIAEKLTGKSVSTSEYHYDDKIDTTDKLLVVHWYYKKTDESGNQVVHYCKYCDGQVLFASENEPEKYPNGWYDHGRYPFITRALFKVKGSLAGYGYQDIGRGDQEAIDILTSAILTNAVASAKSRYFVRKDGIINEGEFADMTNDFVHTHGNLGEDSIKEILHTPLPSFVINMRDRCIDELKESLGNRDVSNGSTPSGITAASAIAALQEQGGKLSRDHNRILYELHKDITDMVIELIRQFYTIPREYRITGNLGKDEYVQYDNSGLLPQEQPSVLGMKMGLRLPCFDIEVSAQKASSYTKMEQNELALQLYGAGVFNPNNTDQAIALLQTMDFKHKDEIIERVSRNGTMLQKYQQLQKVAFQLAQSVDPVLAEQLAQAILVENGQNPIELTQGIDGSGVDNTTAEHPNVERARNTAQSNTNPDR